MEFYECNKKRCRICHQDKTGCHLTSDKRYAAYPVPIREEKRKDLRTLDQFLFIYEKE